MNTDRYIDVDAPMVHVLLTVANSYTFRTRSITGSKCVYRSCHTPPRHCGVGMWFDPKLTPDWVWGVQGIVNVIHDMQRFGDPTAQGIDDFLVERVRGLSVWFWRDVQLLHDTNAYWDETGLSRNGMIRLNELLNKATSTKTKGGY